MRQLLCARALVAHGVASQVTALAHRGFLARARGVPVEALYAHATRQGRRLVLCGITHTSIRFALPSSSDGRHVQKSGLRINIL